MITQLYVVSPDARMFDLMPVDVIRVKPQRYVHLTPAMEIDIALCIMSPILRLEVAANTKHAVIRSLPGLGTRERLAT